MKRVREHKTKAVRGFTAKYGVDRLMWFEHHEDWESAIRREKQIKEWKRDWKIELIEQGNPIGWICIARNLREDVFAAKMGPGFRWDDKIWVVEPLA